MPEFTSPWFLLLTLVLPILGWLWRRRRKDCVRYPSIAFLTGLVSRRARWAQRGGIGLRLLALACLIVGLAGPRWPDFRTRIPTEGIAIAMVVDVSGSMGEQDFSWEDQRISRLEAVKRVFRLFVAGGEGPEGETFAGRPSDLIGLVTFATRPECPCPLTLSHSALLSLLDSEQARTLPTEAETNIGDAIAWALHRLESAGPRRKIMILLSDGEHNVPPPALKPRQAAQLAASLHVPIYTIDAVGDHAETEVETQKRTGNVSGTFSGAREIPESLALGREKVPDTFSVPATERGNAEETLRVVAQLTGARSFHARDARTLVEVCRDIDQLEKQQIRSFQYRRYYEAYAWCGWAALVSLLTVHVLEMTLWRRVP